MSFNFINTLILSGLLLTACTPKTYDLDVDNEALLLKDGIMYYQDNPFSGTLYSKVDTIIIAKIPYFKGKKHGKEEKYYYNGAPAAERYFTHGKKSGTHKAWWNNGQLEFIHQFDSHGNPTGIQRNWYATGQLSKEFNYSNGKEYGTQRKWDANGKITTNYQVINGERFGLIGSENCKSDTYVD